MDPKTKEEARLRIAHLLSRALKADVAAVTNRDPSAAKDGEALRAEVTRLRALLFTLPD